MHTLETTIGIEGRIVIPVAHVQVAGWIWKHDEMIEFGFRCVIGGMIQVFRLPMCLPFLFNFFRVVLCACNHVRFLPVLLLSMYTYNQVYFVNFHTAYGAKRHMQYEN